MIFVQKSIIMNVLGVIPARYGSTRLDGKPLLDICGKPMIQHVYEQAKKLLSHVVVATDDERIVKAVQDFGGEVVMTSSDHKTGTNRCLEAYRVFIKRHELKFDVVVNIQGELAVHKKKIQELQDWLQHSVGRKHKQVSTGKCIKDMFTSCIMYNIHVGVLQLNERKSR